jgi:hypothetical protein
MTARQAASGRRAHQMCSVEMCPWRIDFYRRAWAEIRLMGKSTSMSRFGYGIMSLCRITCLSGVGSVNS